MLTYRLELDPQLEVPLPGETAPHEVWHDHEGGVCAHGGRDGERFWLRFPQLACFSFHPQQEVATFRVEADVRETIVIDLFQRTVVPLIYQLGGCTVLHGSAIRTRQGVVVFCARSHTGKSTLATAFCQRGFPFWADDAVVLERSEGELRAIGLPAHLRLRPPSRNYFLGGGETTSGMRWSDCAAVREAPLALICLLRRSAPDSQQPLVQATQVPEALAMLKLLEHAYSFTLSEAPQRQALLEQYHHVARSVPVWDVHLKTSLESLPLAVEALVANLHLDLP